MTSKTKDQIKTFFETGDKPTQSQFIDLIDSYIDKSGPLGVLETAVSGGGQGFVFASAADAKIIGAAAGLAFLGVTVGTTAQAIQAVAGSYTTTAQAAALVGTYKGAVAYTVSAQAIPAATNVVLRFDGEALDTNNIFSVSAESTRFTVPAGYTKIRLMGQVGYPNATNGDLTINKNGASMAGDQARPRHFEDYAVGDTYLQIISPAFSCAAGDYFEFIFRQNSGGTINTYANQTYGEMELIA